MRLRLQSAWLLETVSKIATPESVFFPYIHRFSALNWLSRRGFLIKANALATSQALLLRAWLDGSHGPFNERNRQKFNQKIKNPLDLSMNPFRAWQDRLFDRQQLDYLFYWREAAFEIEDTNQREIFWAVVYQIMSYWLGNRAANIAIACEPDAIMGQMLDRHALFIKERESQIQVTNCSLEDLAPENVSLVVFPMLFADDNSVELRLQAIFDAWQNGHDDFDQAHRQLRSLLRHYQLDFSRQYDCNLIKRLASGAKMAAMLWSGQDLPPVLYEQELAKPLRESLNERYTHTQLLVKAVDRSCDAYDYLLLFY